MQFTHADHSLTRTGMTEKLTRETF